MFTKAINKFCEEIIVDYYSLYSLSKKTAHNSRAFIHIILGNLKKSKITFFLIFLFCMACLGSNISLCTFAQLTLFNITWCIGCGTECCSCVTFNWNVIKSMAKLNCFRRFYSFSWQVTRGNKKYTVLSGTVMERTYKSIGG